MDDLAFLPASLYSLGVTAGGDSSMTTIKNKGYLVYKKVYNSDEIPILQLNLAYERDRGQRARIKEFLFNAAVNGGDGDGR